MVAFLTARRRAPRIDEPWRARVVRGAAAGAALGVPAAVGAVRSHRGRRSVLAALAATAVQGALFALLRGRLPARGLHAGLTAGGAAWAAREGRRGHDVGRGRRLLLQLVSGLALSAADQALARRTRRRHTRLPWRLRLRGL